MWGEVPEMNQNGIITEYHLRFRQQNADNNLWTDVTVPGSNLTASLGDLQEFATYVIQISAATVAGVGPFTPELNVTTFEDGTFCTHGCIFNQLHSFLSSTLSASCRHPSDGS